MNLSPMPMKTACCIFPVAMGCLTCWMKSALGGEWRCGCRMNRGIYHKLTPVEPNLKLLQISYRIHYLFPPSTAATAGDVHCSPGSRLYTPVDATFAAECLSAAFSAWKFVEQHPNDGGFQNPAQVQTKPHTDPMIRMNASGRRWNFTSPPGTFL